MKISKPVTMTEGILSAIPNRVAILDNKGTVLMVNNAWKAFDWQNKNISRDFPWIGSNHLEAYPQSEVIRRNDIFIKKIKAGVIAVLSGHQSTFHLDYPYQIEANTVWYTINITSTSSTDGLSMITHSDKEYKKHNDEAIEEVDLSNAHLTTIEDSAATPWADTLNQDINKIVEESLNEIFIFDAASLQYIQVNRGARSNLGYTLEELLKMTPVDLLPEFSEDMFRDIIEPLLSTDQEKIILQSTHLRKDGSIYPIEVHLQFSSLGGEQVFVAIILDISETRKAQLELQKLNNYLDTLVQDRTARLRMNESKFHMANKMAKIGYWEVDLPSKQNFRWSEDYFKLYDFKKTSVIADIQYFTQFVHNEDRERVLHLSEMAFKSEKDVQFEFRIITPKGNLKHIRSRKHFLKDESGKAFRLFIVAQDITEQKEITIEREKLLKVEKEMNQMKSRFVAMASHEFRTPLSTILSSTSLIGKYLKSEEQGKRDKHINRIKSSVHNLTSILNDFLSLEQIESNQIKTSSELIDFTAFIKEIHGDTKLLMRSDQKLNKEIDQITELLIDPNILRNILFNLLSNAIKYSPEHTDVYLSCTNFEGNLYISVRDCGIGIPPSEQEQMFSRFFRATNVTDIQGTGLGLTIVKRYLDLLGGTITFESVHGEGTTFKVVIPT